MKMRILGVAIVGVLCGCGDIQTGTPQVGTDQMDRWKAEIIQADEDFSEAISREGLSQWSSYFTPDGAVIQEVTGELRGRDAIQASMDAATSLGGLTSLTWVPNRAEVSTAGDLGYTVGTYRSTGMGPDGIEMVSTGMYVTIWRRLDDGSWKIEMDLGNPLTAPEPISSPRPAPEAPVNRP